MKEFRVKQESGVVLFPLIVDFLLLIGALFMDGIWRWIFIGLSLIFAGLVVYQSRPIFKNFQLVITPKEIKVLDFRGNVVRKIDWKKVEGAAAGFRKTWLIYTYSFYFRVKGDEDLLFSLISREAGLTGKFQNFIKVFVRKKIPVQVIKG
ncbi:hypothetical protein GFV12_00330 [Desulfurobacterium thermolithotrophum]|uniref:hypothetical protein n=1 Tax=Desulfurobacterium thermolithotrophum TaxID=64160 RepID=UPI0013D5AA82|nr:hypothetical protein [Desulfurobacterium thermolithotrophum]